MVERVLDLWLRENRGYWDCNRGAKEHVGLFPGAACLQLTELPTYKAAPLQAPGRFAPGRTYSPSRPFAVSPPHPPLISRPTGRSLARGPLI